MEKTLKIYLISQSVNNDYDTYSAMVVIAENEHDAKMLTCQNILACEWAPYENLECKLFGYALEGSEEGIIIESFNAG